MDNKKNLRATHSTKVYDHRPIKLQKVGDMCAIPEAQLRFISRK
jgi:hypothetical protein